MDIFLAINRMFDIDFQAIQLKTIYYGDIEMYVYVSVYKKKKAEKHNTSLCMKAQTHQIKSHKMAPTIYNSNVIVLSVVQKYIIGNELDYSIEGNLSIFLSTDLSRRSFNLLFFSFSLMNSVQCHFECRREGNSCNLIELK